MGSSKPTLENWLKDTKGPKNTINEALSTSSEILKRILTYRILWTEQIEH